MPSGSEGVAECKKVSCQPVLPYIKYLYQINDVSGSGEPIEFIIY